jgi:hypothetical protein
MYTLNTPDPGKKKNDGYSKQMTAEKIVNGQEQTHIANAQTNAEDDEDISDGREADGTIASESEKVQVVEDLNEQLSERVTEEPEHITDESIEEDRKQKAGINP